MKKQPNLAENIKVRVKPFEKQILQDAARKENTTISSIMRNAVFEKPTVPECVLTVRCIIEKNKIYNRIASMPLAPDIRKKILEEVSGLD